MHRLVTAIAIAALAATLGACSLGNGLSTGSILGGQTNAGAAAVPPPPPPVTPLDRALQVAATSARAERCGFNFSPDKLRGNFLAAEAAQGGAPTDLAQKYDYTRKSVVAVAAADEGYCTEARTRVIKADLGRHLAGDYAPPPRKAEVAAGWFDTSPGYRQRETVNPELLDDRDAKKTKRVSD
jgi:hypothetical protein